MATPGVSSVRLDRLLQQAREPAFWLSSELKLIWVNRAWEALTGHPAASVVGLICRAHGPTRAGDLHGLAGSFYPPPEAIAGRPASTRTLIIQASGERLWRRIEFWPFHGDDGELSALLGLVRDVDEPPIYVESNGHLLRAQLMEIRDRVLARYNTDIVIGQGPEHRRLLDQISAAAATRVPVLITGEPGTGKRLVARAIHSVSPQRQAPLIPIDCAALPPDVLDRELFGHRQIADVQEFPRLNVPENATVLIGDILDLPRDLQARLAAVLASPVRVIAVSTTDPDIAFRAERLQTDLFYSLTTFVIRLSPLRNRLGDLPALAQHLLERANHRGGRQRSGFQDEAMAVLAGYDWPGNVRELANVVDDAHGRGDHDAIEPDDLPAAIRGEFAAAYAPPRIAPAAVSLDDLLTQVERRLIESTLLRARQNKSRAAEWLGISRPRLYRRIKELGLPDVPEPGEDGVAAH